MPRLWGFDGCMTEPAERFEPAGAVHRESNPGDGTPRAVIVRCGTGVPTINADGPAPSGER